MVAVTSPGVTSCDYPSTLFTVCFSGRTDGGALLAEKVFAYPGLGQATIDAGLRGDVPLLMGIVLFCTLLVFAGNTISARLVVVLNRSLERPDAL